MKVNERCVIMRRERVPILILVNEWSDPCTPLCIRMYPAAGIRRSRPAAAPSVQRLAKAHHREREHQRESVPGGREPRLLGWVRPPSRAGRGWLRYTYAPAHTACPHPRVRPCLPQPNRRRPAHGTVSHALDADRLTTLMSADECTAAVVRDGQRRTLIDPFRTLGLLKAAVRRTVESDHAPPQYAMRT
jgi:hypothetical protein